MRRKAVELFGDRPQMKNRYLPWVVDSMTPTFGTELESPIGGRSALVKVRSTWRVQLQSQNRVTQRAGRPPSGDPGGKFSMFLPEGGFVWGN